jgi:ribosome-associated translation inhibitor RaiA
VADNRWVDIINLGGGVHQSDVPLIESRLQQLFTRLEAWPPASVDLWLRVKSRDTADMKTTLEVQVPSLPMLRASSRREDFGAALDRAADKLVRRLNESAEKYGDRGTASIRR